MENTTMKQYIAPSMKIADMAAEQMFLVQSNWAADVKEFKNDDDLWTEEATVSTEGPKDLWDKEW